MNKKTLCVKKNKIIIREAYMYCSDCHVCLTTTLIENDKLEESIHQHLREKKLERILNV